MERFKDGTEFPDLSTLIQRLNGFRRQYESLNQGDFNQIYLDHSQLIFKRETDNEIAYIGINASDQEYVYHFQDTDTGQEDILNSQKPEYMDERMVMRLFPNWGSIIIKKK